MIKWLFSWCGKEKKVSAPLPLARVSLPKSMPYDVEDRASENMAKLHRAICTPNGALMTVKHVRKTRVFAYMNETELGGTIEPGTTSMQLAAYNEDAFWSLAYLCQCKITIMDRWLLQL